MKNTELMKLKLRAVRKVLEQHPKSKALVKAGKRRRDSLLRALIPLYAIDGKVMRWCKPASAFGPGAIAEEEPNAVTSVVTQRLWAAHGVKVQATVMAKALREHIGYARRTRRGLQITPNGIKYVEAALRG